MEVQSDKIRLNIDLWKKSLLDISSRNQAINFRRRKSSTIQIIHPDFQLSLDKFSTSRPLTFRELFDDKSDEDEDELLDGIVEEEERVCIFGAVLPKKDVYTPDELLPHIHENKDKYRPLELITTYSNKLLRNTLRNLMKKSKAFKDENAINVLYVAVGFLQWYESKDSSINHDAPLLFLQAELTQESYDAPFQLTIKDDDFLVNDALLRKMTQEFALDLSFTDLNNEDDLALMYQKYRDYVMARIPDKRWTVKDEIDLGIFSFSKINMVHDLEANSSLIMDHPLIQQISGISTPSAGEGYVDEDNVDRLIQPEQYFHILEADSSQEIAIQSAIKGQSFVLQGPPGTGKSQTITNIITELMARNKKILFVAEKKAALDVVYNNLKKIGLHDYALPIHNSKLDRKQVLQELSHTLAKGQNSVEIDGHFSSEQIAKYKDAKTTLIDYPEFITRKRAPLNKSLYELYGLYFKYNKITDLPFLLNNVHTIGATDLIEIERIVNSFHDALKAVNYQPEAHPWYGFMETQIPTATRERVMDYIHTILKSLDLWSQHLSKMPNLVIDEHNHIENLANVTKLIEHIMQVKDVSNKLLSHKQLDNDIDLYTQLIQRRDQIKEIQNSLQSLCIDGVVDYLTVERQNLITQNHSWFKRLFSKSYRELFSSVRGYFHSKKPSYQQLTEVADYVSRLTKEISLRDALLLKVIYKDDYTTSESYESLITNLKWVKQWRHLVSYEGIEITIKEWDWLKNYSDLSKSTMRLFRDIIDNFNDLLDNVNQLQSHFDQNHLDITHLKKDVLVGRLNQFILHQDEIYSYVDYYFSLNRCISRDLGDFAKRAITSGLKDDYVQVFYKKFYDLLIEHYLLELSPNHNSVGLDSARLNFAEAERMIHNIARHDVEKRIIGNIPNFNGVEGMNSEVTTLRSEANKTRKHLPFRVLFSRIPNLILKLKPCLMMSPLSVSTFLRDTKLEFDTVIFDEASQVKPENAIGALFRAKQYIITGDKEQLPPTNFFQYVDDEEIHSDEINDTSSYDSILDVASSYLRLLKLRWHYRSKFEELIRPSNKEIYHNLITFPSRTKPQIFEGVQFIYVNGVYVDRRNELEADKVVETVVQLISQYGSTKSIGVVTFNTEQQLLIERKLNHFRHKHPDYETFFTDKELDSFFVKNIETVQGDERDIIIISVGYGPDGNGKMSMNFGPLNQSNGYRRLNVAVTRAKIGLIMIASFHSVDIDINRTQARGVVFLKHYLEFAENGEDTRVDDLNEFASFDSPFEEDVYNELVSMGYEVKKQVGSSGYRIDLAVVDPQHPGHFLLGIECDGATYHSSKSVRDRDRLRQQVLENRDWTIYRIWSTDWFKNKTYQVRKLKTFIQNIKEHPKSVSITPIVVPTAVIPKAKLEPHFTPYPIVSKIVDKIKWVYRNYSAENQAGEVICSLAPIHINELKRIVPTLWGRQKYTVVVESGLNNELQRLISSGVLIKDNEFYVLKDKPIFFRSFTSGTERRDFQNIHPRELQHAILEILKITKVMDITTLNSMITTYCGYQSVTQQIKSWLNYVYEFMEQQNVVTIDNLTIRLNVTE